MIFHLILISLLASASAFTGGTDGRIRRGLLNSLKRFHSRLAPLNISVVPTEDIFGENDPFFFRIPFAAQVTRLVPFMDSESLRNTSMVNHGLHDVSVMGTFTRLSSFDPYFATEDHLTNSLLYALLLDHFPRSTSRVSPSFQDELELLTLKFNFDFEAINSDIPWNIVYYLLCFLHEITYGLDSPVPVNKDFGKIHFIRQLRLNGLPLSWEYFIGKVDYMSHLSDVNAIQPWLENVYFFSTKPNSIAVKRHYRIAEGQVNFDNIIALNLSHEFSVAIFEILTDDFSIESLLNAFVFLTKWNSFSKEVYYQIMAINLEDGARLCIKDFRLLKEKKIRFQNLHPSHKISWQGRICMHDSLNQFSHEAFKPNEVYITNLFDTLDDFLKIQTWSLANLEMFSQLIKWIGSTRQFNLNYLVSKTFVTGHRLLIEVLVKESNQPLSIFFKPSCIYRLWNLFNNFRIDEPVPSADFLRFFVDSLKLKDPFIFLGMNEKFLLAFKPLIQDKFNLNRKYRLIFDKYGMFEFPVFGEVIDILKGDIFTFKNVLNMLNSPFIKEVFSSDISVFDQKHTEEVPILVIDEPNNLLPAFW